MSIFLNKYGKFIQIADAMIVMGIAYYFNLLMLVPVYIVLVLYFDPYRVIFSKFKKPIDEVNDFVNDEEPKQEEDIVFQDVKPNITLKKGDYYLIHKTDGNV